MGYLIFSDLAATRASEAEIFTMEASDSGGNIKKNKKKKKQQGQVSEVGSLDLQPYPGHQFMNGPECGSTVTTGHGGGAVGLERGGTGLGMRGGMFLGRKALMPPPSSRNSNSNPQLLDPGQIQVSVSRGNRTVHQNMNPKQEVHSQGPGQQRPAHSRVEQQDLNQRNTAGKGRAKAEHKGGKQTKDAQQKSNRYIKKDDGTNQTKGAGLKSFKGKFRDEDYDTILRELASHRIFELKKRNLSFPNAKYFCRLCEYHLDRVEDCERHMDESRHQRKKEASDSEGILRHIPDPMQEQIEAIDALLGDIVQQHCLTPAELQAREDAVHRLNKLINASVTEEKDEMMLRMYGSSLSGLGLKDSDVNVEVSGAKLGPKLLLDVYSILQNNDGAEFKDVQSDFRAKVPVVRLTDAQTGLRIVVAINAQSSVLTALLLRLYCQADPRVQPLTVVLRVWAKICHLDRQEEGTLPPFAFGIMVVFFLLQIKPPVLCLLKRQKDDSKETESSSAEKEDILDGEFLKAKAVSWESQNKMSVGELWVRLLQFYCLSFDNTRYVVSIRQTGLLSRQEKRWHSKKLAIEDPFSPKKNLATSMANSLIFEYFQSSLRKAYNYFGLPRDKNGSSLVCLDSLHQLASKRTDELLKENQEDPQKSLRDSSVNTDTSKQTDLALKESEEKVETESAEVEEEEDCSDDCETVVIQPNKSVRASFRGAGGGENAPESVVSDCDVTCDSVTTPSAKGGSLTADSESVRTEDSVRVSPAEDQSGFEKDVVDSVLTKVSGPDARTESAFVTSLSCPESQVKNETLKAHLSDGATVASPENDQELVDFAQRYVLKIVENAVKQLQLLDSLKQSSGVSHTSSESMTQATVEVKEKSMTQAKVGDQASPGRDTADCTGNHCLCSYKFTEEVFTGGKGPAVICGYCEKEGHIKANCPEDKLPNVEPLPHMSRDHMEVLNRVIRKVMFDFQPSDRHVEERNHIVKDLENFVREIYPGACFSLFGSSCNGFGFFSSDLDICMTLRGKVLEDLDVTETIEAVASKLNRKRGLYNVVSIPTAKVPIVKFTERNTKLEGDISLYNTLAQRNTKLLWCYSQIDPRVRQLGYAVKVFAKICDIGDASRGSLSSYGYILMMLHYLQQCQPPLIPVLQELYQGEQPSFIVEGCNTWFFEDIPNLYKVWPGFRRNQQAVGELWLGFLRYYLETFDWKGWVVSIRQSKPLTKFEKLWNGQTIAVEDPFDLNHNLGGGLSRKMNNYIYKTFVNGRMHFGTPFERKIEFYHRFRSPEEYFFNMALLSDGKPPNDRGCRMCGKIGHMVKDCPQRQRKKTHQQSQPKEKEKEGTEKKVRNPMDQGPSQSPSNTSRKEVRGHANQPAQGAETQKQSDRQPAESEKKKQKDKRASANDTSCSDTQSVTATSHATTITTTTTSMPPSISSTISSSNSNPRLVRTPPGFRVTPTREVPNLPSKPPSSAPPSASGVSAQQGPAIHKSPPSRTSLPGMRPPGFPVNIQQLFSIVQQHGGNIASLAPAQPQQIPQAGVNFVQSLLSPEQQVALMGGGGAGAGGGEAQAKGNSPTKSQQKVAPPGLQVSEAGKLNLPQPHPLMSLLQSPQSQQQQQHQQQQHPHFQQQHHQQQQQQQQQQLQMMQHLWQQQQQQRMSQPDTLPSTSQQLLYMLQQQQLHQPQINAFMPSTTTPSQDGNTRKSSTADRNEDS